MAHLRSPRLAEYSMSTPLFSMPVSQIAHSEPDAREADRGPYARPSTSLAGHAIDAVLVDAIRATVGPYVPATLRGPRTRETATTPLFEATVEEGVTSSPELPWIDAFLDSERTDGHETSPSDAATSEADVVAMSAPEEPSAAAEQWPLDEAGQAMRMLADELGAREPSVGERAPDSSSAPLSSDAPTASTPPLAMWGDDDMMNIMPVKASPRQDTDSNEHWAARARRESERTGTNEAAALALESLARRVRDGEISIPGYTPDMGDAAALAAALAALLSVRR